jgi:hypothetical protein
MIAMNDSSASRPRSTEVFANTSRSPIAPIRIIVNAIRRIGHHQMRPRLAEGARNVGRIGRIAAQEPMPRPWMRLKFSAAMPAFALDCHAASAAAASNENR